MRTKRMRPPNENNYMLSRMFFHILFIVIQIVQNCLVLYMKWKKVNAMEQSKKNRQKNHRI